MMRSGDTWSNGGFRTSPLLPSSSAARGAGGALRRLARLPLPVLAGAPPPFSVADRADARRQPMCCSSAMGAIQVPNPSAAARGAAWRPAAPHARARPKRPHTRRRAAQRRARRAPCTIRRAPSRRFRPASRRLTPLPLACPPPTSSAACPSESCSWLTGAWRLHLPAAALLLGAAVVSFLLGQFLLPNTGEEGGPGGGGPARISLRQLQRATPSQVRRVHAEASGLLTCFPLHRPPPNGMRI